MGGREFLSVARDSSRGPTEAYWRTAAGRAYYAVMLEIRDAFIRWGLSAPPRRVVHVSVRQRLYTSKDGDMKQIAQLLDPLRDLRGMADYDTSALPKFATNAEAVAAFQRAVDALALFDAIDTDLQRRSTIAAEIRAVFP
jgi:hypothetical protein